MRIKGHTTIILKDVKTGKKEIHRDHNLITNAVQKYLANCGFMNYPNNDKDNMVEELMGGIMCFDEEITESANTLHVPSGCKMVANACVGVTNNNNVLEMGSYSSTESGWQEDGSYLQTYDFTTSQANGTISTVCLAGKNYAYAGEGNSISGVRHTTKQSITNLAGTVSSYSGIAGYIFKIDLTDSSCYAFDLTGASTTGKGVLRKYRLPISKVNIKGTPTAPIILSEAEVSVDNDLASARLNTQPLGDNLLLWNTHSTEYSFPVWGTDWTQYLWTLTPAGVLTKATVSNTSGDTLYGLQAAIFDGNYCFFPKKAGGSGSSFHNDCELDTTEIYVWNRTNNNMSKIVNTYGYRATGGGSYEGLRASAGWNLYNSSGDGRIVTSGNYPVIVDKAGWAYPTNASNLTNGHLTPVDGLIRSLGVNLYRDQGYLASINVLSTPVVKTAEKTMKIVYRLTFEEEEE